MSEQPMSSLPPAQNEQRGAENRVAGGYEGIPDRCKRDRNDKKSCEITGDGESEPLHLFAGFGYQRPRNYRRARECRDLGKHPPQADDAGIYERQFVTDDREQGKNYRQLRDEAWPGEASRNEIHGER